MKSKKKPKKPKPRIKVAPPSKKHKSKKDYNRKNKALDELTKETEELGLYSEFEKINPHAGSKFEDFMKLEQESFGLTTEECGCTPEKGCLDDDPIEFKDHQVHDGTHRNGDQNVSELIKEPGQILNEAPLFGGKRLPKCKNSWIDRFFSIFGFKRKP
jgi:hypothetical protein